MKSTPRAVNSPEAEELVRIIAAKRSKAGISQREMSRRLGLNPTTFWQLERGRRSLQVSELIAAARELGEDPADLLREALSPAHA